MPRFDFDPSKVSAGGFEVLPKDEYEFIVGEPKTFSRTNNSGGPSYGLRFWLTVAEGPLAGKKILYTWYFQSQGAIGVGKSFQIATYGYENKAEKAFNEDMLGRDFGVDTDSQYVGEMYTEMKGKRVIGNLDVGPDQRGGEQQLFKSWRPAT